MKSSRCGTAVRCSSPADCPVGNEMTKKCNALFMYTGCIMDLLGGGHLSSQSNRLLSSGGRPAEHAALLQRLFHRWTNVEDVGPAMKQALDDGPLSACATGFSRTALPVLACLFMTGTCRLSSICPQSWTLSGVLGHLISASPSVRWEGRACCMPSLFNHQGTDPKLTLNLQFLPPAPIDLAMFPCAKSRFLNNI